MIRPYETIFILKSELEDEAKEAFVDRIKNAISDQQGEITEIDIWGDRKLAYEINDLSSGYYTVINFTGEARIIEELEHIFKISDDVLRHIIISREEG